MGLGRLQPGLLIFEAHRHQPSTPVMALIQIVAITTPEQQAAMRHVRDEVFVKEQHVPPALEMEHDAESHLYLLLEDGLPAACGRWRIASQKDGVPQAKIERCAVLWNYRKLGYGKRMVQYLISQIPPTYGIYLHAQTHAKAFYERLGFRQQGSLFFEADIEHVRMQLNR